jgi:hypothetical protein
MNAEARTAYVTAIRREVEEGTHFDADNLLIEVLLELGEDEIVDAWLGGSEEWLWG